jgi:hypothetical protein
MRPDSAIACLSILGDVADEKTLCADLSYFDSVGLQLVSLR